MPLNLQKWLPETRLEFINYGDSTLILSCYIKPKSEIFGKTFEIGPFNRQYIMVKELLPEYVEDPSLLSPDELSLIMKNVGSDTTQFNIFEEGPFKHKTFVHPLSPPLDVITLYAEYLNNLDNYSIKKTLKEPISDLHKQDKTYYPILCLYRAKMYSYLTKIEEANAWMEVGWKEIEESKRWGYCFQWASILAKAGADSEMHLQQKNQLIQKTFEVLETAQQLTSEKKFMEYHLIAINCLKAFLFCYLNKHDDALNLFETIQFRTLTAEEFMDKELNHFFEYLVYGFSTAIELKDGELLRNLCSLVVTGAPEILDDPSPTHCMHRSLMNLFKIGRTQTNTMFGDILKMAHLYEPELPNFRQFVKLTGEDDEIELNSFIPYYRG